MMKRVISAALMTILLITGTSSILVVNSLAWSNGGFSNDPDAPIVYGTHDWIAQHALDWLPDKEKQYINDYLGAYLYGTELPDNKQSPDGIGDTSLHHIYFDSEGRLTDDAAAVRAVAEFNKTLTRLRSGDYYEAAENAGVLTHYIADVASFGHVMGAATDWGSETHHSSCEDYVNRYTSSYNSTFNSYLVFDGLNELSPYGAAVGLAKDTTFDKAIYTAVWMDQNYDWANQTFKDRVGQSLNLAVNYTTDVLYTLFLQAEADGSPPAQQPSGPSLPSFPPVNIPLWAIVVAVIALVTVVIVALTHGRPQPRRTRGRLVRLF